MNKPVVSIIIPVYNVSDYLPRCIESILSQTFINFELILVDDGSTDRSGKICDEYASQDNRIRVFHKENGGAGAARKFGVQFAKGDWIEFVDADDTIPCDSVEKLYNIAKEGEYDVVIGTLNINNRSIFEHKISGKVEKEDYIRGLLLGETSKGPVAKLYKSTLYKSLEWNTPKEITNNEDLLMLVSLATKVKQVFIADNVIAYNYLFREGSASKSKSMSLDFWVLLFNYIESLLQNFLSNQDIYQALFTYEIRLLYCCNVLQGEFLATNSSFMKKLKNSISLIELEGNDEKKWKILQSPIRQRIAYIHFVALTIVKSLVKKMIGRK